MQEPTTYHDFARARFEPHGYAHVPSKMPINSGKGYQALLLRIGSTFLQIGTKAAQETHIRGSVPRTVGFDMKTLQANNALLRKVHFCQKFLEAWIRVNGLESGILSEPEFAERLVNETNALREAHASELKALEGGLANRITQQEQDLTIRSRYQFDFAQGLTAIAGGKNADARAAFRRALGMYKSGTVRQLIPARSAATALANLFTEFWNEDQANFVENAKKELGDEFYNDLEAELSLAAVTFTELAPLLKERKWVPSRAVTGERTPQE